MSSQHELPAFVVGRRYNRRDDIHLKFGGSRQSGISPSATHPVIFIFTGESGAAHGYHEDGFDESGVFAYTGEGQSGDMHFTKGNKALRDHAKDGRAVHLFRALGKGKPCEYLGEFSVASHHIKSAPDRNGELRETIVFHLFDVSRTVPTEETAFVAPLAPSISIEAARKAALEACTSSVGTSGKAAVRRLYERSEAVRLYVLMRESGLCRGCNQPAPFLNLRGEPYLEPHHTTRLSDGGLDHPRHVVSLCPNCHTEVHRGLEGAALNRRLIEWLNANEPEA